MRVVLLLPKLHAGAELALNRILPEKDIDIVGMVRSDISISTKRYWNYVKFGLRRSGVFYAVLIGLLAYTHLLCISLARLFLTKSPKWLTLDELIKRYRIPTYNTTNINTKATRACIESWEPDVMVSLYFDQILKAKVIKIPKVATLNMHPGILPRYRGIWPEFWKMLNDEEYAGVSIHHLIEKVDAGDVIAQEKFAIEKEDTKLSLVLKTAQKGSKLLIAVLKKMKEGKKLKPLALEGTPNYYSLPDKKSFNMFHAKGKKLFSPFKMWRMFRRLA